MGIDPAMTEGTAGLTGQLAFFTRIPSGPEGLRYAADFVSPEAEQELIRHIAALPLQPFQFGPYEGKPFSSHGDPSLMLIKPSARKAQFNMT